MTYSGRIPPPSDGSSVYGTALDRAYGDFAAGVVTELTALDPVTTEIIRLRCAAYHDCRVCSSVRSASAVSSGFGEAAARRVLAHSDNGLSEAHSAVAQFTDALIGNPSDIDENLVELLRGHYSDEQITEIILDIVRWSFQKVKVALRIDAPRWDGLGTLSYDEHGRPVIGTAAPMASGSSIA
jgi:alkylhydroperoxidase family enzyme